MRWDDMECAELIFGSRTSSPSLTLPCEIYAFKIKVKYILRFRQIKCNYNWEYLKIRTDAGAFNAN